MAHRQAFTQLLEIMSRLRDPEKGCPWDLEQHFDSIVPHTLEEAYEVADAIDRKDFSELQDELGDLLFQVVFLSRLAEEQSLFDINDVCEGISAKLTRRHPHIFADENLGTSQDVSQRWEQIKADERRENLSAGLMAGVAKSLPALKRAQKLQKRAAHVGFDWPAISGIKEKVLEELAEIEEAVAARDQRQTEMELGDLLFSCVNLCRRLDVDAENALRRANSKFSSRFKHMESMTDGKLSGLSSDEFDELWSQAKKGSIT